ncbi:MAG: hypothetical protein ACOYJK_08425 [Prevotella sp.]|jgi:hypothetical protein
MITATEGGTLRITKRITSKIKEKKGKTMTSMTFLTLAVVAFVAASALALVMDNMVEGRK